MLNGKYQTVDVQTSDRATAFMHYLYIHAHMCRMKFIWSCFNRRKVREVRGCLISYVNPPTI